MDGYARFIEDREEFKEERPYVCMYMSNSDLDFPSTNTTYSERPLNLIDLRSIPKSEWPTLENDHFCFTEHASKEIANNPSESNAQPLADEVGKWLKELMGAEVVIPWISRFRSADKTHGKAPPATDLHSDFDLFQGWRSIESCLSQEERDWVLSGKMRARIMNVWRPMYYPAEDFPLAILDPHTVLAADDFLTVDRVTPGGVSPSVNVKFSPSHRWYWLSEQKPEEVVVFTQLDTHPPEGVFNHVGHGAFRNEGARPGCPPRQSVESRFVVLTPAAPNQKMANFLEEPEDSRSRPWADHVKVPVYTSPPPADPKTRRVITGPPPKPLGATLIKAQ